VISAEALVADPVAASEPFGSPASLFVRPDSPLKPFSGRVLKTTSITLQSLDHGLYYDDVRLPVVVAPVRSLQREWRYVVADRGVVAGTAYDAEGRNALPDDPAGAPWRFAAQIAEEMPPPEAVYVIDVCETEGDLRLLELNPFSGADLYGCPREDVVAAVSRTTRR
jgi:hypothetical protein